MKKSFWLLGIVVCSLVVSSFDANAQRKATRKRYNTNRSKTKTQVTEPVVDTTATTPVVASNMSDSLSVPIPVVPPSLRNNTSARQTVDTVGGKIRKNEKTPLAYENLREDDELYKQVLWRNINTKEKMNLPFGYENTEDNGDQRFILIMLKALKEGINDSTPLIAFKDDQFRNVMKPGEISSLLVGTPYTQQVPDLEKDPDLTKGIMKDTVISDDFDPSKVQTYQIKEEVIFDRKTSRLHWRILGIAPLLRRMAEDGVTVRAEFPLFWIYYPDFRPVLAKYEAYNPRNAAMRMSWEEVFESHYFSSYVVKSTLNNTGNQPIANIIKDPILRLHESDNIKDAIFNYEQNLWSY
jgi:gliding motility associated protien GldN